LGDPARAGRRLLTVFDLDGTLVDSRKDLAESANALIASYGGALLAESDIARMVGDGAAALVRRVLEGAGIAPAFDEALARYLAIYDRRMLDHTRPYGGIPEAVLTARQFGPCAVLTNKPSQPTRRILDAFALTRHFIAIVAGDDGFRRKPEPDGLQHIMRAAGADARATLMIGDSFVDVEVARRAGTSMCVACYGFGFSNIDRARLDGNERFLDRPADLAAVLEQLARDADGF
jgi:phosphoglycolate phosphatase